MSDASGLALVRLALAEDLAGYGDITSAWTVPAELRARGTIIAGEEVVACGMALAEAVMREVDETAVFTLLVQDGTLVVPQGRLAVVEGFARSILTAERTMLNFISHLSGIATQSRRFATAVEGTSATVVDTRKTTPGLRVWEKRAVVCGGCANHRFGLFDLVLVKDNHITAAGGIRAAIGGIRAAHPGYLKVEVEVEDEHQLREAISCGADIVMLDNQDVGSLRRLVEVAREVRSDVIIEASGGITLGSVRMVAETGVDVISTSAITMGAPPVDVGLTLDIAPSA